MDSFGMMSGAYFIGRKELLSWLNERLYLNYTKVEQCASGAAHCQIMDAVHPGKVPLSKVNFNATQTYEFVENYKVLQKVFKSVGLERIIDVNNLIRAKYQDNLEFLQWIKCYHDNLCKDSEYDAEARRKECGVSVSVKCGGRGPGGSVTTAPTKPSSRDRSVSTPMVVNSRPSVSSSTSTTRSMNSTPSLHNSTSTSTTSTRTSVSSRPSVSSSTTSSRPSVSSSRPSVSSSTTTSSRPSVSSSRPSVSTSTRSTTTTTSSKSSSELEEKLSQKESKITNLTNQIKELNQIVDALGKERDFYFNRLRNVEIYCQTHPDPNNEVVQEVERILYSTEEGNNLKTDFNDDEQTNNNDDTF